MLSLGETITPLILLGGSSAMIELAQVAKYYQDQLLSEYGHVLQASHHRALKQIITKG